MCGMALVAASVDWIEEGQALEFWLRVGNTGHGSGEEVYLANTSAMDVLVASQGMGTVHACFLSPRVPRSFALQRCVGLIPAQIWPQLRKDHHLHLKVCLLFWPKRVIQNLP